MPGSSNEYNLLLFEDKQKQELVHIRAQKDYKLHALHNSYINIDVVTIFHTTPTKNLSTHIIS